MSDKDLELHKGDYPFDLLAGKQFMFVYIEIVEYQYVGDTKAPLIRVIDPKQRLKNDSPFENEPTNRTVVINFEYKKLLSKNFLSIGVQLRTETGRLVPFTGTGKVILALSFKNSTKLKHTIRNSQFRRTFRDTIVNGDVFLLN